MAASTLPVHDRKVDGDGVDRGRGGFARLVYGVSAPVVAPFAGLLAARLAFNRSVAQLRRDLSGQRGET